jgi:hypothetical protein
MSYVLSILLVSAGFIKQNSKIVAIILFCFLWILFGWNRGNVDYDNYVRGFSWAHGALRFNSEIGTQLLYKLFILIGLEYKHFLIITSLIGLLLINNTIKTYTKNVALVFSLYLIFPFVIDVVQSRGFLSMSIILYASQFIIEERKGGTLKYIILILLASSIHYSAIFYITFILIKHKDISYLTVLSLVLTITGLAIAFTNLIPKLLLVFVPLEKVAHYLENRLNWGILVALVVYASNFFLVYYSYHKIKSIQEQKNNGDITQKTGFQFVEGVYKINILLLLLFILYVFNMIFFRLYRNILILNYIAYAICLTHMKPKSNEKFLFALVIFAFTLGLFVYYIIIPYYDSVFLPVFQENALIGK